MSLHDPVVGNFVWLRNPYARKTGPQFVAEKWPLDAPSDVTAGREVVSQHQLKREEYGLSILILEKRYSPPPPTQEASS